MNATQRGINPYRPGNLGGNEAAMRAGSNAPYDARAKGVDGDMLDAMMKGRWQEGHEQGFADGSAAARARYPDIYDEAFEAGKAVGSAEESALVASEVLPMLQHVGASLVKIGETTGSKAIEEIVNARIEQLKAVLDAQIGRTGNLGEQPGQPG